MWRASWCLTVSLVLSAGLAVAADWSPEGMFSKRVHDFGTVARSAKAEYEFEFTNNSQHEVHISNVRASCSCTTPKILKETLKPGESSSILAVFNTRTHLGQRAATITVSFDRPYYSEVQLQIRGYVRQDIVINPGVVRFGSVSAGDESQRKIDIEYAGRGDWKILEVVSPDENLLVDLQEKQRAGGRIGYELLVKLKPGAPAGYFHRELTLVTNDRRATSQRIPLLVEGRIAAGVSVSPASLYLGEVQMGEEVARQFVVRAAQPFRVLNVLAKNAEADLNFETDNDESRTLHVITVRFTPNQPGKLEQQIEVKTDLEGQNEAHCMALADVSEPNPAE